MTKPDMQMRHYAREALPLVDDVPGARQWAVSLDQTMLTYFEVDPESRFESHAHESEQITTVLEGILYFEQNDTVIAVKPGEAIAIPSNAPHAVFTKEAAVRAIDAWSPIMAKYRLSS